MDQLGFIDWDVAARAGRALVPPGPSLSAAEVAGVVAALKRAAAAAPVHVEEVTGLPAPAAAQTLVVDRPGWIKAGAASVGAMLGSIGGTDAARGPLDALMGRVRGGEVGAVLAAVSTRILGQFDPFADPARLLLVAPNIVAVERDLGVHASDFRLWVCLHETTHQFQFGRAPWLREHLLGLMGELLADGETTKGDDRPAGGKASATTPDGGASRTGGSILGRVLSPAQLDVFDRVTAVMSLVEGYADVMMDRVGTGVVPTLPVIRRAFEQRRDKGGWTAVVGRLLGNDLKLAQYREGAAFCRAVIERAGVETLNATWSEPAALPTIAEVRDPAAWLRRVPG